MSVKFTHSPALQEFAHSPATAWIKSLHKLTTEPMPEFKFSPSTAWMKDIPCVKKSFEKYGNASPSKDESSVSVEIEADHKPPCPTFLGSELKPPATVATFCQSDSVEISKTDLTLSESGLKPPVTYSAADYDICQLSAADDSIVQLSAADDNICQLSAVDVDVSQPLSDQTSVSGIKLPVKLSDADDNVCQPDQDENCFSRYGDSQSYQNQLECVKLPCVHPVLTFGRTDHDFMAFGRSDYEHLTFDWSDHMFLPLDRSGHDLLFLGGYSSFRRSEHGYLPYVTRKAYEEFVDSILLKLGLSAHQSAPNNTDKKVACFKDTAFENPPLVCSYGQQVHSEFECLQYNSGSTFVDKEEKAANCEVCNVCLTDAQNPSETFSYDLLPGKSYPVSSQPLGCITGHLTVEGNNASDNLALFHSSNRPFFYSGALRHSAEEIKPRLAETRVPCLVNQSSYSQLWTLTDSKWACLQPLPESFQVQPIFICAATSKPSSRLDSLLKLPLDGSEHQCVNSYAQVAYLHHSFVPWPVDIQCNFVFGDNLEMTMLPFTFSDEEKPKPDKSCVENVEHRAASAFLVLQRHVGQPLPCILQFLDLLHQAVLSLKFGMIDCLCEVAHLVCSSEGRLPYRGLHPERHKTRKLTYI